LGYASLLIMLDVPPHLMSPFFAESFLLSAPLNTNLELWSPSQNTLFSLFDFPGCLPASLILARLCEGTALVQFLHSLGFFFFLLGDDGFSFL